MGKISTLPAVADNALAGTETVVIVKDGASKRASIGGLATAAVAPSLALAVAAKTAAETAFTNVDQALIAFTPLMSTAIFATKPELRRFKEIWMNDTTKQYSVQWCSRDVSGGVPRMIARICETADTSKVYYVHTFGANTNPTTAPGMNGGVGKVLLDIYGPTAGVIAGQTLFDLGTGENFGTPVVLPDLNATKLNPAALGFTAYERTSISALAMAALLSANRPKPWGSKATAVPAYLAPIKTIKVWNANGLSRDVRVSLYETSATQIRVHIFDHTLNDQVGYFLFSAPDYSSGGVNLPDRISLTGNDPLGTLPVGDPSGANYTGLQGYMELHKDLVVQSGAVNQPTTLAEGHIDPIHIYTPFTSPARIRDTRLWQYSDVIECGPSRQYVTPRAAVEALYTPAAIAAMESNPLRNDYQPESLRANPINPVLILCDLPNAGSPLQPWQDANLHLPEFVSLMSRYPGAVWFEHSAGATRPIVQAHLSHQLIDINWRNTMPEGALSGTSSARYAVHRDYLHLYQSPDAEGDVARSCLLQIIGGSIVAGVNAQIQPFGSAIPVNDTVQILDVILDTDGAFSGPLISANNSSSAIGGGQLTIRNCWDKSGRVANPANGANSTVGVQTKLNTTYANILNVDGCKGFAQVALSPVTAQYAGKWLLRGNNNMAVYSTIAGDTMGV